MHADYASLVYLKECTWGSALKTSHWDVFKITFHRKGYKGKRSCSPPTAQGRFALCGERPGLPALDPASWSQLDRLSPLRGVVRYFKPR